MTTTPVLITGFDRPDKIRRLLVALAEVRPSRIYVALDGTAVEEDIRKCEETRKAIESIWWPCSLTINASEVNLGCRRRMSTGIAWLFENEEEAIILEDDCIPHPSFFGYCDELLERYTGNPEVMMICGFAVPSGRQTGRITDYFFAPTFNTVWGWATWRRAWRKYDDSMPGWQELRTTDWLKTRLRGDHSFAASEATMLDRVWRDKVDTWDYVWKYCIYRERGKVVIPTRNMIENIGYGSGATHTHKDKIGLGTTKAQPIRMPLRHPRSTEISWTPVQHQRRWIQHQRRRQLKRQKGRPRYYYEQLKHRIANSGIYMRLKHALT